VDWQECFPELTDESLPGRCLRGPSSREGMTQKELAKLTGIPQRHISEMENGRRPIGNETAKRLAKVLHFDYRLFL
jgi:transcriptional regulator with XRE-family HTH domain